MAITHDDIGNPLTYGNKSFTWYGRRMASYNDGTTTTSYKYNEDGVRTSKTVGGTKTEFFVDGTTILAQKTGNVVNSFYYDANGKRIGFKHNGYVYYYVYNLQGDVTHILNSSGGVVGEYTYDAWGNITNLSSLTSIARQNPFRYRGYYYDTESGLYYLNSRYYNPEWGRFLNADDVSLLGVNGDFSSYNLFAYCGNNPIVRRDTCGTAWETVFDLISLAFSIYDVFQNPNDILAWVGLAGDTLDLIPFVTGLGEAAKAVKITDSIVDSAKVAGKIDAADAVNVTKKVHGNSLQTTKNTVGYALRKNNTKEIMKFGETTQGTRRYTQKFYRENDVYMDILVQGSKYDMHYWQHQQIIHYYNTNGCKPPWNKSFW